MIFRNFCSPRQEPRIGRSVPSVPMTKLQISCTPGMPLVASACCSGKVASSLDRFKILKSQRLPDQWLLVLKRVDVMHHLSQVNSQDESRTITYLGGKLEPFVALRRILPMGQVCEKREDSMTCGPIRRCSSSEWTSVDEADLEIPCNFFLREFRFEKLAKSPLSEKLSLLLIMRRTQWQSELIAITRRMKDSKVEPATSSMTSCASKCQSTCSNFLCFADLLNAFFVLAADTLTFCIVTTLFF